MDHKEQTLAFRNAVSGLTDRYREEFDLTIAQVVGVLEVVKLELWMEQYNAVNDEEGEDDSVA